ncbi:hypothetical protein HY745_13780 [Candidatus Desantisbacteria bacterium]|nr:hypothetical protein [Candidatus Desantisbacteria bacterium]
MSDKDSYSIEEIIGSAELQDSLLQSYRNFHLTVQSIFIAIGAGIFVTILSFKEQLQAYFAITILLAIFLLSAYLLWCMRNMITERGKDVDFWHVELIKAEQALPADQRLFTKFKIYQKLKRENHDYLQEMFLTTKKITKEDIEKLVEKGLTHTRKVLDKWLFVGLWIIWALIVLCASIYTFGHLEYGII